MTLELSEEKTKIVYCKHGKRPDRKEEAQTFTFLGHDFKPKTAKNSQTGKKFLSFLTTVSIDEMVEAQVQSRYL